MCPTCRSISIECNFYQFLCSVHFSSCLWTFVVKVVATFRRCSNWQTFLYHCITSFCVTIHFPLHWRFSTLAQYGRLRHYATPEFNQFAGLLWGEQNGWFVCNSVTCTWVPWKSKSTPLSNPSSCIRPYQTGFIIPFQNLCEDIITKFLRHPKALFLGQVGEDSNERSWSCRARLSFR